jgi:ferredoxin
MDEFSPIPDRSGWEPELGGILRDAPARSGWEPELGGELRVSGVYVDEVTCIGCKHCAHVAPNTFYIQEAMDTCPVNCIHWVDYTALGRLEKARKSQVIKHLGFPQIHHNSHSGSEPL